MAGFGRPFGTEKILFPENSDSACGAFSLLVLSGTVGKVASAIVDL